MAGNLSALAKLTDKRFNQYMRIWPSMFRNGITLGDRKGICKGASLRWAECYSECGSDIQFWKKYAKAFDNLRDMAESQRSDKASQIKYSRSPDTDRIVGEGGHSKFEDLWHGGGAHGVKGYNIVSENAKEHAVAAAGMENGRGVLFDPNVGQFNIPSSHFKTMSSLWLTLWEVYNIKRVYVYDIHPVPVSVREVDEDWLLVGDNPHRQSGAAAPSSRRFSDGFEEI